MDSSSLASTPFFGFEVRLLTYIQQKYVSQGVTPASLGYDRVRFLAPVFFGDTITVTYTIKFKSLDQESDRSRSDISVTNQRGELVAVAEHIMKWVKIKPTAAVGDRSNHAKKAA